MSGRLDRTLQLLSAAGRGPTWRVRCPAHADDHASLDLKLVPGKLLVCCRAGCLTADVLDAKGLRWSDLFEASR